jgi:hypothetical protein
VPNFSAGIDKIAFMLVRAMIIFKSSDYKFFKDFYLGILSLRFYIKIKIRIHYGCKVIASFYSCLLCDI